ncbi:zinc finger protein RFP-like [Colossoma macropomum]|uniref:zinc finger protein RFP-like n=1 Tax=Colossoma macropomum TaxID=42526 RepID=UPI001863C435|nr:zinc finger protein RFP-like [Colossoma macropomum]
MASSSTLLSEEQFQCSICLDVFTDPVSTPCGHNFCMACLSKCWDNSQNCQCPFCKEEFSRRPELRVNTFISGMVLQFSESLQAKSSSCSKEPPAKLEYVPCDVCTDPKGNAVKSCLDCGMSFCDLHLEHHKIAAKLKKHKLINAVKNLEDYICQKHDRAVELYCRDDQKCVCLFCTESDHKTHNTVPIEEESGQRKAQMKETQAHIQKMIQDRMKKIEEIKHAAELKKKNADKEKADSIQVFTALISTIERIQAELLEMMEKRQKATEIQAEGLIKELEKEITKLKGRETELEQLSHTEDHLHLLQICPSTTLATLPNTSNWTEIKINTDWSTEDRRKALFQLQQLVSKEIEMSEIIPDLGTQRAEIKELLKTQLLEGDTWYLVDSCWFKQWKKYVGFDPCDMACVGEQDLYPGPVDNSGLLQDTDSHSIKNYLIDELDYILLPTEGWYKLIRWYGLAEGQKPIARKVVGHGMFVKHYSVEVYLTELKLCECGDMDNIINRSFSKTDTVSYIEKEMRSLFSIPDEKVCRLWNKYMSNTFEPLNKPEVTIQDARFYQGQVLVIEQKNEDGTWPGVVGTNISPGTNFKNIHLAQKGKRLHLVTRIPE